VLTVIIGGVFFILLVWVRRRDQRAGGTARQLRAELADTQGQLEKSQRRVNQIVSLLSEMHEHRVSPTGAVSWANAADFAVQTASHLVGMDTVVLAAWDPSESSYRPLAARGLSPKQLAELRIRPGEGILGKALETGQVLTEGPNAAASPVASERFLSAPYVVLPLWIQARVNGFLAFCKPQEGVISPETLRLASLMAKHVELTLENLDLYESRQRVYSEMVSTLAQAINVKGVSSSQHGERVRNLVKSMAQGMHLPAILTEQIEFGALLHDVGKLGIDEALLIKPAPFTDAEYAIVKQHPKIGYDLLRRIGFFSGIAPIVLYHHEWVNGQGYPEGLAGEEIPLGARMVAVADAWDRMVVDQPFRKAMSKNNAIAELRQKAGTQFDPQLVDVFLHMIDQQERVQTNV
jgi:response regulator RpfG family c-di-GMP phosphodiesterase